ncbi:hypothetical protein [Maridesulfovibrio frigidus]|uniref:hypothetical protein n=1 Tax=Maridesulfovibrio frigidus TaxID=340956 RepID=UPI0004E1449E|nr:hypothetical protein [Maridesulfovibrio frigidus]
MKISDKYLIERLLKKFETYTKVAEKLGYSGYRPFRTALTKGLPEAKRVMGMMLLEKEDV